MGHNMGIDYARYTKNGFLLGLAMFAAGGLIGGLGPKLFGSLPEWELTIAFDMMIVGFVVGFVAVFGFGVVLPLTE